MKKLLLAVFLYLVMGVAIFILLPKNSSIWSFYYFFFSIIFWELKIKEYTEEIFNIRFSEKLFVIFFIKVDKK